MYDLTFTAKSLLHLHPSLPQYILSMRSDLTIVKIMEDDSWLRCHKEAKDILINCKMGLDTDRHSWWTKVWPILTQSFEFSMIFQATQLLAGVFCYHPKARHCDVDLFELRCPSAKNMTRCQYIAHWEKQTSMGQCTFCAVTLLCLVANVSTLCENLVCTFVRYMWQPCLFCI